MSAHVTEMHAHSPASYSLSLMIHGAIAAVLLVTAYLFNDVRKKNDGIFEVVAGPGDNWNATVAPALGTPDAPDMPGAPVVFTPPAPAPTPIAPAVETPPETAPATPATATPTPRDALVVPSTKTAKQPAKKTDAKQTPAKNQPAQPASQTKMTKADFDKLYAAKNQQMPSSKTSAKTSTTTSAKAVTVTAQQITPAGKGLLAGVDGGSGSAPGAGGRALTVAERDQMDAYFATLADRLKQAHEKPESMDRTLVTRVEYYVGPDGTIGAVKIIKSSGNRAYDDSVLKAFRSVRPIGPRPDGRGSSITADFRVTD